MNNRLKGLFDAKPETINSTLTKRALFAMPEGKYLVSGPCHGPGNPVFAETVAAVKKRESQWRRIVLSKANGRNCFLFETQGDYSEWLNRFGLASPLN